MEKTENIEALLARLKTNKEKVPICVLKTKYKAGYEKLIAQIKEKAIEILKPIATEWPKQLADCVVKREHENEIVDAFNRMYETGGYAKKIGAALYKHYSIEEAREIAKEINKQYREELLKIFNQQT